MATGFSPTIEAMEQVVSAKSCYITQVFAPEGQTGTTRPAVGSLVSDCVVTGVCLCVCLCASVHM